MACYPDLQNVNKHQRLVESNRIISSRKAFTTELMAKYLFVNINAEFDKATHGMITNV